MKTKLQQKLATIILTFLCMATFSIPAFAAALDGFIDEIDATGISGWAKNSDSPNDAVTVELQIYKDGSTTAYKTVTVKPDQYRSDPTDPLGGGNHKFYYEINWTELEGTSYQIKAYILYGSERVLLSGKNNYTKPAPIISKSEETVSDMASVEIGPGVIPVPVPEVKTDEKRNSLGMFTTTAYCCCDKCTGGNKLTYSGTTPQANHTISADINVFPLGTKLMMNGIIYTVEDIGSSIQGNKLDIYFPTHEEALLYGRQTVEVFTVD